MEHCLPSVRLGTVDLGHGIWPKPRLARAEPDELPVPEEIVSLIGSYAVPPRTELVAYEPVRVPDLGCRVLHNDPVAELKALARELWTFFLDFFGVLKPPLHVTG